MISLALQNPIVFVVGCPRSGTTLLQRMLDAHPDLAVANDTHFIPRALQRAAPANLAAAIAGEGVPLTPELVDAAVTYRRFSRIGVAEDEARRLAGSAGDYSGWIAAIYDRFARACGKSSGGEKTPDYVRHLPLLHGLFPGTGTIHIVRDGRDVALSALQWATAAKGPGRWELWEQDSVGAAAVWWRHQTGAGLDFERRGTGGSHMVVRYEDLVADPERELRSTSAFLGIEYSRQMVEYHAGRVRSDPRKSAKANWLPPTPGLRDWRSQMSSEDVAVFEQIAGAQLAAYGYEPSEGEVSAAARRRAERCERWWHDFSAKRAAKERAATRGTR